MQQELAGGLEGGGWGRGGGARDTLSTERACLGEAEMSQGR